MKIYIDYDSIWQASFIGPSKGRDLRFGDDDKDGKPAHRKYVSATKRIKKSEIMAEQHRPITKRTVMGILNRLLGDQRTLEQAENKVYEDSYYFEDIEDQITFETRRARQDKELVYLHNAAKPDNPGVVSGVAITNAPAFTSEGAETFWNVLVLEPLDLCRFIVGEDVSDAKRDPAFTLTPDYVLNRMNGVPKDLIHPSVDIIQDSSKSDEEIAERIKRQKLIHSALDVLSKQSQFEGTEFLIPGNVAKAEGDTKLGTKKPKPDKVSSQRLYIAALYLNFMRLKAQNEDLVKPFASDQGVIKGFTRTGKSFTSKDFKAKYWTGKVVKTYANPYPELRRASGELVIDIDVDDTRAEEIFTYIEQASVPSIRVGKKGLSYVSHIII